MAVEMGGTPRAHRPPAAGHGFQRHAGGPRASYRRGCAMSSTDDAIKPEDLIATAIKEAEDIRDPLEGIVEKTGTDPGAPFAPDALERLAVLKKDDRAAFEALRARLKSAGCRVTALDEAIAEESGDAGGRGPKQADFLIGLAQSADLFRSPDGIWRVIDNPPVRFRRAAGMQPLPMPVRGGSVEALRSFLNLKTDTDFVLAVAWILACLRDRGP